MPRMNGLQVIEAVRKFIKNYNMLNPIQIKEPEFVFLTAYSTIVFQNHAQSVGVTAVYEKPLQLEQLRTIVN
jgi:CheY-like chemotaxis protein